MQYLSEQIEKLAIDSLPWQKRIGPGDYIVRILGDLVIYGEILPLENEEDKKKFESPTMKDVRYGKFYSVTCPNGETGNINVESVSYQISKEQFEVAKKHEWPFQIKSVYAIMNVVRGGSA